MQEEINENISQFIDNELSKEKSLKLLQQLQQQSVLDEKMSRYELVRSVIKNENLILTDDSFVQRVNVEIQQEPTYLLPNHRQFNRVTISSILAIAASFALVAVVLTNDLPNSTEDIPQELVLADNQPQQKLKSEQVQTLQPVDSKFYEHLYAHRGSLYIAEPSAHPYAKLAGYGK